MVMTILSLSFGKSGVHVNNWALALMAITNKLDRLISNRFIGSRFLQLTPHPAIGGAENTEFIPQYSSAYPAIPAWKVHPQIIGESRFEDTRNMYLQHVDFLLIFLLL